MDTAEKIATAFGACLLFAFIWSMVAPVLRAVVVLAGAL